MTTLSLSWAMNSNMLTVILLLTLTAISTARPLVRQIQSAHEFDRLIKKHASSTGLPVIADFYSDGCGPCRQIAPIYQQIAKETGQDKAVFVKVNTQMVPELSGRYQIRSIPTFIFFVNGKQVDTMQGAGAQQLQQMVKSTVNSAQWENVKMSKEALVDYYKEAEPSKALGSIETVYNKCAEMNKKYNDAKECVGSAAHQLNKRLKQKYNKRVETTVRFTQEDQRPGTVKDGSSSTKNKSKDSTNSDASAKIANLHLATKEQLLEELEKRAEAEADAMESDELEEEDFSEFAHSYVPSDFPERVVIVGGGPAGMSAAIYAARAGLKPVVVAPPMGGQLQGKGVDVENYPGLANVTGPEVVSAMRNQAAAFGAVFECDSVTRIDDSIRPYRVYTNDTVIETHAIIVATGAESNWLNVPGEYEMRGGGVSSCAICDGAAFYEQDVVVVGGGDTAMEEALVLARTSKTVTVIHRREEFRASRVLAQRVMNHPSIKIEWNTILEKIEGEILNKNDSEEELDMDKAQKVVNGVVLKDVKTGVLRNLSCAAVFVAIGHTPTTSFLEGIVNFDDVHKGYIKTSSGSTKTSAAGIFAAGDVSDAIYRQAVTSAGSGAAAALDAERWLSEEGLGNEEAEFEAELLAELMADGMGDITDSNYNAYEDVGGRVEGMKESARVDL